MRARIAAVYAFLVGLITNSLGPFGVGVLTDYVFEDQNAINFSLLILMCAAGASGAALMIYGRAAFGASAAAVTPDR
jgi:hypothetical protein